MSQQDSLFQEGAPRNDAPGAEPTPFTLRAPETDDLRRQVADAQRQISNLLILLLVISGTLAIYLIQQWRYTRADLAPYKGQEVQLQQAARVVADFNKSIPARQDFLKRLAEYARQDPKVLPILFKYGLAQARPATNASPAQPKP